MKGKATTTMTTNNNPHHYQQQPITLNSHTTKSTNAFQPKKHQLHIHTITPLKHKNNPPNNNHPIPRNRNGNKPKSTNE